MFNSIEFLVVILSVVTISEVVFGGPYANSFPYLKYGYNSVGSDAEGSTDGSGFVQNQLSDQGNNIKTAQDSSKFYNMENLSNNHNLNHQKQGTTSDTVKQTTGEDFETDKSHNRKQIKSGFHNSYHKDESGNNSSYYEDSDDRGGKLVYDKRHGSRGDIYDTKYQEGLRDGTARDKYDDRSGGYNSRGNHERQHLAAEDQGNRHGHRDGYVRGQGERFELYDGQRGGLEGPHRYGINERYGHYRPYADRGFSEYNGRPSVSDFTINQGYSNSPRLPHQLPLPALHRPQEDGYFSRQRITIYEDPRDLIDPRAERRGEFPHVAGGVGGGGSPFNGPLLDFRPGPARYRDFDGLDNRENLRFREY